MPGNLRQRERVRVGGNPSQGCVPEAIRLEAGDRGAGRVHLRWPAQLCRARRFAIRNRRSQRSRSRAALKFTAVAARSQRMIFVLNQRLTFEQPIP
jgi:hypothetical protein